MRMMRWRYAIITVMSFCLFACGNEGPFGNTPGPKKPQWSLHLFPG